MPYELHLALRYLRARHRGRAAQVTTFAAVAGIACGVAAYIIASALATGFRDEMQDKILRGTAHITVARTASASPAIVADAASIVRRIKAVPGVRDAVPTTYTGVLLIGDAANAYAVVRGVAADSTRATDELRRTLVAGRITKEFDSIAAANALSLSREAATSADEAPVIVGAELAARTGLRINSSVQLVAADAALRNSNPLESLTQPRIFPARVVGIFRSGLHDYDATWVYMPLAAAQSLTHAPSDSAPVIAVEATDAYRAPEVAAQIRIALGAGWTIVTWAEANGALFAALALERQTVNLIISLITLIAGLNILTTLVLVVMERRRHIAILVALGAQARSIMAIFVIEGGIIGATGAGLGVLIGLLACHTGNAYQLVRLPPDVYSISSIPFHPRFADVALACGGALVVSLLATLYPARTAARIPPGIALREEN